MSYVSIVLLSILLYFSNGYAATYHVAKTGSNSNTCTLAQSPSTPKLTIAAGISCLAAGDTLRIAAGTYNEGINGNNIPSGTSWSNTTKIVGAGMASTKTTPNGTAGIHFTTGTKQYIEFSDFEIDATNADNNGINFDTPGLQSFIRFRRLNIHHAPNQGALVRISASDIEFIEVHIHHIGPSCYQPRHCHSIYAMGNNILVDRALFHDNTGFGIQFYPSPTGGTIRNSIAHSNVGSGIAAHGSGVKIFNNTTWKNGSGAGYGIGLQGSNGVARNNIAYDNLTANIYGCGGSNVCTNNLTTNPSFSNAAIGRFHLQAGSAAINAGTNLASAGVTIDYDGVARPQGAAYDIGAYEYVGGGQQVTPPTDLQVTIN